MRDATRTREITGASDTGESRRGKPRRINNSAAVTIHRLGEGARGDAGRDSEAGVPHVDISRERISYDEYISTVTAGCDPHPER